MKHFISKIAYSNYSIIRSVLHSNYSSSKISIRFSPNFILINPLRIIATYTRHGNNHITIRKQFAVTPTLFTV